MPSRKSSRAVTRPVTLSSHTTVSVVLYHVFVLSWLTRIQIYASYQSILSYIYNCPIRCCNRSLNVETVISIFFRQDTGRRHTSITNGLFVNDDIGSVGPWSRYSSGNSSCVRFQNDPIMSALTSLVFPRVPLMYQTRAHAKKAE